MPELIDLARRRGLRQARAGQLTLRSDGQQLAAAGTLDRQLKAVIDGAKCAVVRTGGTGGTGGAAGTTTSAAATTAQSSGHSDERGDRDRTQRMSKAAANKKGR